MVLAFRFFNHFPENAGIAQQVDKKIIQKIYQLVEEGVRKFREMQRHINIFVRNKLFRGIS